MTWPREASGMIRLCWIPPSTKLFESIPFRSRKLPSGQPRDRSMSLDLYVARLGVCTLWPSPPRSPGLPYTLSSEPASTNYSTSNRASAKLLLQPLLLIRKRGSRSERREVILYPSRSPITKLTSSRALIA